MMQFLMSNSLLGGCPMCRLIQRGCLYTNIRGMGIAQQDNHYKVLGVPNTATAAQIKDAYIDKCKQHHPDANPNTDSHDIIVRINAAYDVLGDPAKKMAYDQNIGNSVWGQTVNRSRSQPSRNHQDFRTHQNMGTSWENNHYFRNRMKKKPTDEELFREWIKTHHSNFGFGDVLQDLIPIFMAFFCLAHICLGVVLVAFSNRPYLTEGFRRQLARKRNMYQGPLASQTNRTAPNPD